MSNTELQQLKRLCALRIKKFKIQRPLRAQSLLMTVFGDSILPHGGVVWLGSLIKLVEPFGINQRLVRTSVYRLVQDNWLEAKQIGRRSYYELTKYAVNKTRSAEKRIYSDASHVWDGEWRLVFTGVPGVSPEQRELLHKELLWQGFGKISQHVYGHPVIPTEPVTQLLEEMKLEKKVVVMLAKNIDDEHGPGVLEMVSQCCDIESVKEDYKAFIKNYKPIDKLHTYIKDLDSQSCFLLRTLLIHDFRRVLLRDPQLPKELLPNDWPGDEARMLSARIYNAVSSLAEAYVTNECETADGGVPAVNPYYYSRFASNM